jgi:hypothetical protein
MIDSTYTDSISNVNINLRALLFETPSPDGVNLFSNAASLAKQISSTPSGSYYDKIGSVSALLTQVFQRKRKCPNELRIAILTAVRERLQNINDTEKEEWVQKVNQAIDLQNSSRVIIQPIQSNDLFKELLRAAEQAEEQFIITPKTVEETVRSGNSAELLKEILVRRLGLYKEVITDTSVDQRNKLAIYKFCLPTEQSAIAFWQGLFERIILDNPAGGDLTIREAYEKLEYLNDAGNLQVYKVPSYMCGNSIVVFNPHKFDSTAFSFWDLSESILKWSPEFISLFKGCVYYNWFTLPKERIGWKRAYETNIDREAIEAKVNIKLKVLQEKQNQ